MRLPQVLVWLVVSLLMRPPQVLVGPVVSRLVTEEQLEEWLVSYFFIVPSFKDRNVLCTGVFRSISRMY